MIDNDWVGVDCTGWDDVCGCTCCGNVCGFLGVIIIYLN